MSDDSDSEVISSTRSTFPIAWLAEHLPIIQITMGTRYTLRQTTGLVAAAKRGGGQRLLTHASVLRSRQIVLSRNS